MYIVDFADSCSMATADKCNGNIPTDGTDAFNSTSLMEVDNMKLRLHQPLESISHELKYVPPKETNLFLQQIKRIETAVDCQLFCSEYYSSNCTWWMYDETINYCKIFKGPQEELYEDCFELGYSSYPFITECQAVLDPINNDQCHVKFYIYYRRCVIY